MANIPTIVSDKKIYTGAAGSYADASSFGVNTSGLARGLDAGADAAAQLGQQRANLDAARTDRDNQRWTVDRTTAIQNQVNSFIAQNPDSETLHRDVQFMLEKELPANEKSAPSKEAADMFHNHMASYAGRTLQHTEKMEQESRTKGTLNTVQQHLGASVKHFNTLVAVNEPLALENINRDLELTLSTLDATLGVDASAAKENVVKQYVQGIMGTHPGLARKIATDSKDIDEISRAQLLDKIDGASDQLKSKDASVFMDDVDNQLANIQSGGSGSKIGIESFKAFLPASLADSRYAEYSKRHDIYTTVNQLDVTLKGSRPDRVNEMLAQYREHLKTSKNAEVDRAVFDIVLSKYSGLQAKVDKDPAQYIASTSPLMAGFEEAIVAGANVLANGGGEQKFKAAVKAKDDYIMLMQTPMHPGEAALNPQAEARRLNVPADQRRLLTVHEANHASKTILKGTPQEGLAQIQLLAEKHDEKHWNHVVKDLQLPPDMVWVWHNRNRPHAAAFMGAIQNKEDFAKLDDVTKSKLDATVASSPLWLQFQASFIDDFNQFGPQLAGMRTAINAYAGSFLARHNNMDAAVKQATSDVIGSTMGFATVHGKAVLIDKEHKNANGYYVYRSDEEVTEIGRRLQYALSLVDVRDLNYGIFVEAGAVLDSTSKEPGNLEMSSGKTHQLVAQAYRDMVTENGVWRSAPDGQRFVLYLPDSKGTLVAVKEKGAGSRHLYTTIDRLPVVPARVLPNTDENTGVLRITEDPGNWTPTKRHPLGEDPTTWPKMHTSLFFE